MVGCGVLREINHSFLSIYLAKCRCQLGNFASRPTNLDSAAVASGNSSSLTRRWRPSGIANVKILRSRSQRASSLTGFAKSSASVLASSASTVFAPISPIMFMLIFVFLSFLRYLLGQ